MKKHRDFFSDNNARIPFSVIGVLLLIGSSMATMHINNLESQKAVEIASTIDFNEVDNLLRYAQADLYFVEYLSRHVEGRPIYVSKLLLECLGGLGSTTYLVYRSRD